jgi:hypothetical protein
MLVLSEGASIDKAVVDSVVVVLVCWDSCVDVVEGLVASDAATVGSDVMVISETSVELSS